MFWASYYSALSGNSNVSLPVSNLFITRILPEIRKLFGGHSFSLFPSCPLFLFLASRMHAQHSKSEGRSNEHRPSMAFSPCVVALECAGKRTLFVYVKCGPFYVPYHVFCSGILAQSWFLVWFVALHECIMHESEVKGERRKTRLPPNRIITTIV